MKEKILDFIKKHPLTTILLTATLLYIIWTWLPLGLIHSWNEAYYLQRVTHITQGGSYLDWRFDNPPLFVYTLTALSKIFGINETIFRLFIVFCTLTTTLTIYQIGLLLGNKKTAIISSSLFAFFPMTILFSKIIQIDMFAVMLITATFYFTLLAVKKEEKYFILAGIFLGLTALTKLPAALIFLPIIYYLFYKKTEIKHLITLIITATLVPLPWIIHVLLTKPSFLKTGATSSSNFFGLGNMHSNAPIYQLTMILLAIIVTISLILYFWKHKPKSIEQKTLIFYTMTFTFFFLILPNHEYYLLPVLPPLFIYIGLKYKKKEKWKKYKKILILFLIISIAILAARPFYEINWEEATNYVKENYPEDVTIYSTNPRVTTYYTQKETILLTKTINNTSENNTILMFTNYDKVNLENLNIMQIIKEKFILLKKIDNKIFIYGSKNLTQGET